MDGQTTRLIGDKKGNSYDLAVIIGRTGNYLPSRSLWNRNIRRVEKRHERAIHTCSISQTHFKRQATHLSRGALEYLTRTKESITKRSLGHKIVYGNKRTSELAKQVRWFYKVRAINYIDLK